MPSKKLATTETFKIPAPNIKLMKVQIKGTSPLIFHKWSEKAIKMIVDKQMKKAPAGREVRDPEADYLSSFYLNPNKEIYLPSRNVKQAIVGSARFINGLPMTILRGTIFVWGEEKREIIPVLYKNKRIKLSKGVKYYADGESPDESLAGYDPKFPNVKMRRDMVTVGMGTADVRFRGQVEDWSMTFMVQFDADQLSAEQVLNLLQRAGYSQGLGEWRPERNGDNGTFEVHSTSATQKN